MPVALGVPVADAVDVRVGLREPVGERVAACDGVGVALAVPLNEGVPELERVCVEDFEGVSVAEAVGEPERVWVCEGV